MGRNLLKHLFLPLLRRAFMPLKHCWIIPSGLDPAKKEPRTVTDHMVGVMIFIVRNEFMVQQGFDLLHHGPVQPGRLFQHLYMLVPLFLAKLFKLRMQAGSKLMPFKPLIKQSF